MCIFEAQLSLQISVSDIFEKQKKIVEKKRVLRERAKSVMAVKRGMHSKFEKVKITCIFW